MSEWPVTWTKRNYGSRDPVTKADEEYREFMEAASKQLADAILFYHVKRAHGQLVVGNDQ